MSISCHWGRHNLPSCCRYLSLSFSLSPSFSPFPSLSLSTIIWNISFSLSDNPYISLASPSMVTTFLGRPFRITYTAAYNSAGFNNLINRLVVVFTNASTGAVNYNFGIANEIEGNQYQFMYTLASVGPWHRGVYTVRTQSELENLLSKSQYFIKMLFHHYSVWVTLWPSLSRTTEHYSKRQWLVISSTITCTFTNKNKIYFCFLFSCSSWIDPILYCHCGYRWGRDSSIILFSIGRLVRNQLGTQWGHHSISDSQKEECIEQCPVSSWALH